METKNGMLKRYVVFLLGMLSSFVPCLLYAITIDKMIVFGDSLSDNGNIYSLTTIAHKTVPLVPIIPKNPPYFNGRFSNGPVWVDIISERLQVGQVNYAYGGSWAEPILDSKINVPFGLGVQVSSYLVSAALDFNKDQHLYVLWTGANDYLEGRSDPDYATSNTVAIIRDQIEWLTFYGARNFLVLNLPDLSALPEVVAQGSEFATSVSQLVQLHNDKLAIMIQKEQKSNPDNQILFGDVAVTFNDVLANPDKYHLKNTTQACYTGGYWLKERALDTKQLEAAKRANVDILAAPSLKTAYIIGQLQTWGTQSCDHPDDYLFWDSVHPTRVVHQLIAEVVINLLNANGIHGRQA